MPVEIVKNSGSPARARKAKGDFSSTSFPQLGRIAEAPRMVRTVSVLPALVKKCLLFIG